MTATAYPLSWPIGWKRTAANHRTTARFSRARRQEYGGNWKSARPLTTNEAVDRLQTELDRIGARQVVLSSNLELRELSLIYAHCRARAKHEWYWSSEPYGSGAWACYFGSGNQDVIHNFAGLFAVAIRRIPNGG